MTPDSRSDLCCLSESGDMLPAGVLVLASGDMLPAGVLVLSSLDGGYCWDPCPFMEVTLSHCLRGAAPELGIIKGGRTIQVNPHASFPLAATNLSSVPRWGVSLPGVHITLGSHCPWLSLRTYPFVFGIRLPNTHIDATNPTSAPQSAG